ncbi:hypothetical protein DOY81_010528 [Sarcophaga bullata]|nr:hypothetical protein DOY81_010528 [Sarcophaga bullata]
MAFKFIFAIAFVAVASAGYVPATHVYHSAPVAAVHAAPVAVAQKVVVKSEEYDPHPQYKFNYGVEDKCNAEMSKRPMLKNVTVNVVTWRILLDRADGYKRLFRLPADDHKSVKTVAPVAQLCPPRCPYAAPAVVKTVAPVATVHHTSYDAPTYVKSAPVAHYAAPTHYATYEAPSYSYHH